MPNPLPLSKVSNFIHRLLYGIVTTVTLDDACTTSSGEEAIVLCKSVVSEGKELIGQSKMSFLESDWLI